jgi:hypothetical protein
LVRQHGARVEPFNLLPTVKTGYKEVTMMWGRQGTSLLQRGRLDTRSFLVPFDLPKQTPTLLKLLYGLHEPDPHYRLHEGSAGKTL